MTDSELARAKEWHELFTYPRLIHREEEAACLAHIDEQAELLRRFYEDDAELIRLGREEGVRETRRQTLRAIEVLVDQWRAARNREWSHRPAAERDFNLIRRLDEWKAVSEAITTAVEDAWNRHPSPPATSPPPAPCPPDPGACTSLSEPASSAPPAPAPSAGPPPLSPMP